MSRICVPGWLALLAAGLLTSRGADEVDLWGGGKIEIKLDLKKLPAEAHVEMRAMADAIEEQRGIAAIMAGGLDFRFDPKAPVMLNDGLMALRDELVVQDELVLFGEEVVAAPVAEPGAETADEEESEARELNADEKKALEAFVKKAVEARRKQFAKAMESQIDGEVTNAKLDKASRKKLEGLVAKAVEASMPGWEKAFRKYIQPVAEQNSEGAKGIEGWTAENYTRNVALGDALPRRKPMNGRTDSRKS